MDLASVQSTLKSWVSALSGIPLAMVLWQNEPRPQTIGISAVCSWISMSGVGIDETRREIDESSDPTGTAASIVAGAAAGLARVTGLSGMDPAVSPGLYLAVTGCASTQNNITGLIAAFVDSATVDIVNPLAVIPDANNGAIGWTEYLSNVTNTTAMQRKLVLQISFETNDQRAATNSRNACELLRGRVYSAFSVATLYASNIGLIDADDATQADYTVDQRWISRTIMQVRFNATSLDVDTQHLGGIITSAQVASTLTDPGGTPLPSPDQINEVLS